MATVASAPVSQPAQPDGGGAGTQLPPDIALHPFLQTLAWTLAPTWLMERSAKRLGDTFTLTFWPSRMKFVLVSDPDAVKTIFTASPEVAPSATGNSPLAAVMGPNSVLTLIGPEHIRQRKLLLPPFHGERMREYEETIVEATRKDMASWPRGVPMRLQDRTRSITLEVILSAVFGVETEHMGPLRQAIGRLTEPSNLLAFVRIALSKPGQGRPPGRIGEAIDTLDKRVYEEIARHRSQDDLDERKDILSLLMQARDEDGQAMTDEELRDELVTLLLAGHETTATAVAWAVERLVRHPEKLARLRAEIDEGQSEEYMNAVVNETLRVRPVVPIVVRLLQDDLQVGIYNLPKGVRVAPSIYLTNRNARIYEQPLEFRPERFLGAAPETFSWIPFGGGIRRCIGASFALLEMKLMLRTMLSELQPALESGRTRWRRGELARRRAVTLVPMAGAKVMWEDRRASG